MQLTRPSRHAPLGPAIAFCLSIFLLGPPDAVSLVFASPNSEPADERPTEFPYWEHVTQRRYEGPTVIYLGAGWALTAQHVGVGEIFLEGETFAADMRSRHILVNANGTGADAIVFRLKQDTELPDLPILPLALEPPRAGEEVMLIGFGRERAKVIEWNEDGDLQFGFEWTPKGAKRWGTNRVTSNRERLIQLGRSTHTLTFVFDPPNSDNDTRYEAQAALGDSGGAMFIERDGEWQLAGMMTSVSTEAFRPRQTSSYGDATFAADIAYYRDEILRWARPSCANERDDDGDRKIDFPLDPGCHAATDRDERDAPAMADRIGAAWAFGLLGVCALGAAWFVLFRSREPD